MAKKKKQELPPNEPLQNPALVLRGDERTETVDVVKTADVWSEYKLSDGTVLKAKPAVIHIRKVVGKFNLDGKPIYQVQVGIALDTLVPPRLMKKKR